MQGKRKISISAEPFIWVLALVILAVIDPHDTHFSLCPMQAMGLDFCPGCGLGKSISFLFHGSLHESWRAHPLGIFAVVILVYRIATLFKFNIFAYGKNN